MFAHIQHIRIPKMLTHFLTFQSACLRHMQIRFASVLFIGVVSCGACPSFGQAVLEQPVAPTAGQQVAPPVSEAMPSKTPAGPAKSSAASLARLTNDTRYLARRTNWLGVSRGHRRCNWRSISSLSSTKKLGLKARPKTVATLSLIHI